MDKFKQANNNKATSYDFYDRNVSKQNNKLRAKDKKMLHQIARAKLKKEIEMEE